MNKENDIEVINKYTKESPKTSSKKWEILKAQAKWTNQLKK